MTGGFLIGTQYGYSSAPAVKCTRNALPTAVDALPVQAARIPFVNTALANALQSAPAVKSLTLAFAAAGL